MTEAERECQRFAALAWSTVLADHIAPTEEEADHTIALAASYGPHCTTTD